MRRSCPDFTRREVLQGAGLAALPAAAQTPDRRRIWIVSQRGDAVAAAPPARWAAGELRSALEARGIGVSQCDELQQAAPGDLAILACGPGAPVAGELIRRAGAQLPPAPESLVLSSGNVGGRAILLAAGRDVRGLVYGLLELADRVRHAADPAAALEFPRPVTERPANRIRSITRCFVSDVEDKPWYNDRAMWPRYLSMLAAQRFNRFSLTLGIGYDFPRNITDCYFHFAYPFLVSVPGYRVRASGLPDDERDRNLEMLRFISDQTAARGLHFQLGLWTHAYEWTESPRANYVIEGLTPETHAAYCRDALRRILDACPAISGVTFRVHGESGVAEGSYDFWKTVFDAIAGCGRRVEIDMHAKGIDQRMIDIALATGMPVNVSPKFWAEHMGLPYHQAAIRELEMPPRDRKVEGFFALSSGSRRFMRYGYGDLLREDRRYGVLHRIWPGTQRLLLWGDPAFAAAYGRAFSFCDSAGVEICEPLSFKGRKGSGLPGGRCAYADASLKPAADWEKYLYTYRLWGRLLYNPNADPETWRRFLRRQFGADAALAEAALAHASRILPLVTTAHGVSGANNSYWPEMYANMPIVDANRSHPYSDTPSPKRFGAVSPFDPQLFATIDGFAEELLKGNRSGKYSPLQVAEWLEELSSAAARHLEKLAGQESPEFRRLAVDVAIESGLGRFFAAKFRAGVLYALFARTGERAALLEALKAYRAARAAWAELAGRASGVYAADITFGYAAHMRGHWLDRLAAIDADLGDMEKRLAEAKPGQSVSSTLRQALERSAPMPFAVRHIAPAAFRPGVELPIELSVGGDRRPSAAHLHYRHVNQAEQWQAIEMERQGARYRALIPAGYTASPYPLQYYFELRGSPGEAWLAPGLGADLTNQPYYIVRATRQRGGRL